MAVRPEAERPAHAARGEQRLVVGLVVEEVQRCPRDAPVLGQAAAAGNTRELWFVF
jgi:hypothetical protein